MAAEDELGDTTGEGITWRSVSAITIWLIDCALISTQHSNKQTKWSQIVVTHQGLLLGEECLLLQPTLLVSLDARIVRCKNLQG